jgi:hypothetical protein
MAEPFPSRLAAMLRELKAKESQPASASILTNWITHAESRLGNEAGGGRLGWLIASSVAVAALQRALGKDGRQLFLLKGGNLLQHRLDVPARTTKDIDGLVRGDIDDFIGVLDEVFLEPWGPFTLRRGAIQVINVPTRLLKPRRFEVYIELRGTTWRRVQFEISHDEAGIGEESESIESMPLSGFGLPDLDGLVGLTLRHQIAQKFHAVSDPHNPPETVNDRPRDVVDLILLRDLVAATGHPARSALVLAAKAVFDARAEDSLVLGLTPRYWPPHVVAHQHWAYSYHRAADEVGLTLSLVEAVAQVNHWITDLFRQ